MRVKNNTFINDCKIPRTKNWSGMPEEDRLQLISGRSKAVAGVRLAWQSGGSITDVLAEGHIHQE